MTITTTDTVERYIGDGSQSAWPVTFPFFDGEDVKACIVDSSGAQVDLVYGQDYTVSSAEGSIGGTLYYTPADNIELTIWLNLAFTQGLDLHNTGALDVEALETAFDRLTLMAQQLQEESDRSVKVATSSTETPEALLASLYSARTEAASSASAAATSESNAAGSEQAAATSESNAASSASAAAGSAITAQTWAESETAPDPNDAESKSAKSWAMVASDNVPIASTNIAGKARTSASWEVDPETGIATVPAATTSLAGIARQATDAEASAGEEDGAYVTPVHIKNAIDACRASDDEIAEGTSTTKFPSVAQIPNLDLSNVSDEGKDTAVGWGMPDYINSVDYTNGTSFEYDGYIIMYTLVGNASSVSQITVTIYKGDEVARVTQGLNYAEGADGALSILPLPKGYNMVFVSNNTATATIPSLQFCPCIGVNYASEN